MASWIKMRFQERVVSQTVLFLIMRVCGTVFGFLFWVMAARLVASDSVGIASGAISGASLLSGLAQLGLGYGLMRYLGQAENPSAMINQLVIIIGIISVIEAVVFLAGTHHWSPTLQPLRTTGLNIGLFIVLVGSTALSQLLHWVFLAQRRLVYSLAKHSVQSIAAIIFLVIFKPLGGYLGIVAAYAAATMAALMVAWIWLVPRVVPMYQFGWPNASHLDRRWFHDAIPNYLADQLQRAPDTILPLLALHILGPSGGATFFIVWSLGSGIRSWAGAAAESLLTEGMHQPDRLDQQGKRAIQLGLALTFGFGVIFMVASQPLLTMYGVDYAGAGRDLLLAVVASGVPWMLLALHMNRLRIMRHHRAVFGVLISSNGLGILVCGALMAQGAAWAGIGWLGVQTCTALITSWWPGKRKLASPSGAKFC